MPTVELSDRFCDRTKPADKRIDYFDSKTTGLFLRMSPTGVRSFAVLFGPEKKRVLMTLGRYPRLSLARARTLAIEIMTRVEAGEDPRHGGAMTVADIVRLYIDQHVRPKLRSAKAVERRLSKNMLPVIGSVALADLHKRDVHRVIQPIIARGKQVEAARVFEDVRAMVRSATAEGHLDRNPVEGMRKPAGNPARERTLSDAEIAKLWNGTRHGAAEIENGGEHHSAASARRAARRRGRRNRPASSMPRSGSGQSPVRGRRTAGRTLSRMTTEALEIAKLIASGPKITGHAVAHTIRLAQDRFGLPHWTAHDLRRTVVTNMAELGVQPIVLGAIINHISVTRAGVTLGVYQHYDYAREKRAALELWADRVAGIVGAGAAKVLPMQRRK